MALDGDAVEVVGPSEPGREHLPDSNAYENGRNLTGLLMRGRRARRGKRRETSHEGLLDSCPGGQVQNTLRLFGSAPGQVLIRENGLVRVRHMIPATDHCPETGPAGMPGLFLCTRSVAGSGGTRSPRTRRPGDLSRKSVLGAVAENDSLRG